MLALFWGNVHLGVQEERHVWVSKYVLVHPIISYLSALPIFSLTNQQLSGLCIHMDLCSSTWPGNTRFSSGLPCQP